MSAGDTPDILDAYLEERGYALLNNGISLYEFLKRPEIDYSVLEDLGKASDLDLSDEVKDQAVIVIKYEGYIDKQMKQIDQFRKLENKKLREDMNYDEIEGLRLEARQKLNDIKPSSIGQASRISVRLICLLVILLIF